MVRLEEIINKAIPGCGLKALPHIDSRLKTLVTKFRAIVQMLGTSGFNWDDERKMISVERSVYDEYCKKSATVKVLIDSGDDEDIIFSNAVESADPLKKVKREHSIKRKGGKKEGESSSNSKLASLQGFMKDMNVHLSTMANVMSRAHERKQEIKENSDKVLDTLLGLEGITPEQALEVAQILAAQPSKLMIFFKCPDALKCIFVKSLLP
ncbi:hypothetical protein KSS87_022709 [Heliosperma pusillum]|nr:hypothetical protein KSS87_022709 [Heliosperma pusillum]